MRYAPILNNVYKRNYSVGTNYSNRNLQASIRINKNQQIQYSRSVQGLISGSFQELKATNNVLDIKSGVNYKIKTLMHGYVETIFKNDRANWLWSEVNNYSPDYDKIFSKDELDDMHSTNCFVDDLSSLAGGKVSLNFFRESNGDLNKVLIRFNNLGITPGKFQIKGYNKQLFLDINGWVSEYDEVERFRDTYNKTDFFKRGIGLTKDSKFIIDGNEYHLDDTGHLNIPEGVICTPSRVKVIK